MSEWIPCSERLPEAEASDGIVCKPYLITVQKSVVHEETALNGRHVTTAVYIPPIPSTNLIGRWRSIEDSTNQYGEVVHSEVVAWMPLPEPYKGEQ